MTVSSRGGGWRGVGLRGAAIWRAVRVEVSQLHGCSDFRLVGVVLLQVACQGSVVPAAVRAVLPPAHRGTTRTADVYVDVIVYVSSWGCQRTDCGLGSRWGCNRCRAGEGGAGAPRSSGRSGRIILLLRIDRRRQLAFLAAPKHSTPYLFHFLFFIIVVVVIIFLLFILLPVWVTGFRVGEWGGRGR